MTDFSHDGADDGFHEIQLSGKHLVFLFMTTTVVSVVIFLCGVLVGRGVRGDAVNAAEARTSASAVAGGSASTPEGGADSGPAPNVEPETTTAAASGPGVTSRLEAADPVTETVKAVRAPSALPDPPPAQQEAPPQEPATATPTGTASTPSKPAATPPPAAGPGPRPGTFAVQVVALSDRSAAAAVVQRLVKNNYPAFLVNPSPNAPVQTYKVQVGKYADRAEAEAIRLRLKKEEQFEPIIRR